MYGDFDFDKLSEQDIREAILAPLLRELGYRHSSTNDIITEQTLRYPKLSLGRKKSSDPALRGKADYILEVDGRWRWVIEAKAPAADLGLDDREQAWSYAVHPEVKAIYAVISNGRQFEIHRTTDGPNAKPVFAFGYNELQAKIQTVRNLLSPDSLRRDYPAFVLDTGKPLGVGLRSFAKLVKGSFTYTETSRPTPGMSIVGMNATITEGAVERQDDKILVYLKLRSTHRQLDEFNRALGLDKFDMWSADAVLSVDAKKPTVFSNELNWIVKRGTLMPNPMAGGQIPAPYDLHIFTTTTASGVLNGSIYSGLFSVTMEIKNLVPKVQMKGDFEVTVS